MSGLKLHTLKFMNFKNLDNSKNIKPSHNHNKNVFIIFYNYYLPKVSENFKKTCQIFHKTQRYGQVQLEWVKLT